MEKKINKWCICITFILVVGLICGFTTYKVVRSHNEKLTLVETKYIIETARKCINEHKCKDKNNVTLKELYDLKHELVSAQIKLESTEKAMKSMQDDRSRESKK